MNYFLLLSIILLTIGVWGVLRESSILKIFMSIEVILASINLFVLSLARGEIELSNIFIMFVWLISVAEIGIVLAVFILMYRRLKTVNVNELSKLKW